MIVLDGPAGNGIGANMAKMLDATYSLVHHKIFPDGESYIRIPSLPEDDTVVVVQSTYAPHEKHLIELLFMIETLKEMGVKHIAAVVPYLAYVRQNRMFTANESISINTVMKLLSESGADALVTVEPHRYDVVSLFKGKVEIVDPSEAFADELQKRVKKPFVIATDSGDMVRAKKMADLLDCEYDFIEKERDLATNQVRAVSTLKTDLRGKEIVIFDDVISTGGTIELAAKMATSKGAGMVIAAAAHLVMANNAFERIMNAGVSEVYGTNSIPFPQAHTVDISAQIAEAVKKITG